MEYTISVEREGKVIYNETLKNLMHHEGMYMGIVSIANPPASNIPDHFAFISAGTWTSSTKTGATLTEFTTYTTDGGATRPASSSPNPATMEDDGGNWFVNMSLRATEVIEVTSAGTVTGVCLTTGSTKGTIAEMFFSVALSLSVSIGDKITIRHRLHVSVQSDLH